MSRGLGDVYKRQFGEQVSLLDGTMNIQPATGGGTAVVISMPMNGGDSYENFVGR